MCILSYYRIFAEVGTVSKTEKWMLPIILPLIVLVSIALWATRSFIPSVQVSSQSGRWDLLAEDFDANAVSLDGQVEYVPHKLLTPEEFANADDISVGTPQTVSNVNTSRITLALPDGDYMLLIRSVDYSSRIFVNGNWASDAGVPAYTAEQSTPGVYHIYLTVPTVDGQIEIVQQAANHIHADNGYHNGITIGKPHIIRNIIAQQTGVNAFMMGLYLALTITHLVLYLLLRTYKVNLYASLLCLTWLARTGTTGMRILAEMFPRLPLTFLLRLEYICLPASCVLLTLTLAELFPEQLGKRFRRVMAVLSCVYAAIILFADTMTMTRILPLFYATLFGGIGYVVVRFAFKLRGLKPGQGVMLAALLLLFYSVIHEVLMYLGMHIPPAGGGILEFALMVFLLFQTTVVIFNTIQELADSRMWERELMLENESLSRINKERQAFFGDLSHELKMPLTVISGYAQYTDEIMDDEHPDTEEMHDNMRRITLEAERLGRLVAQMMDVTAMERGHLRMNITKIDLIQTFQGIAQSNFAMMNEGNNRLKMDVEHPLPLVWGDRERIIQVGINLLSNACRHTKNGVITAKARQEDGYVKIFIIDTGEGIAPELLPLLLNTYPKSHGGSVAGSGLGLYICNQLVHAQGGDIGIESTPGEGTAVWFTLPVCTQEEGEQNHGDPTPDDTHPDGGR